MTSIMTNPSAMTALASLQATNRALEATQNRISTGYRVAEASDNAAYWSIATTMRSDNKALSTVRDALGLGAAKVDTAYTAMDSAIDVVDEIKAKLVAAREPGVDKSKVQSEITQLQQQLIGIGGSASFSGENWLSVDSSAAGYTTVKQIVASFTRGASGTVTIGTLQIDIDGLKLFDANDQSGILDTQSTTTNGGVVYSVSTLDISALTNSANDLADLDELILTVDGALQDMASAASDLGAAKSRIAMQLDFASDLMDAIERGVGTLVDADMNEESTRLQALQVQQQLGIQALSIANAGVQGVMKLFQ
ncbi:flagellin N-terminal helical domain-containing protein [Mesorhizobium sp. L-8-3]|uniref:flagellin N-terminal helical domain-containing protein n=1 Tax=Mesorhizobium sp. L-8-3 TaxID=2744522 RepID=UPI00192948EC|nr:flagellin [Mesorhizobium sp. L-8-3]BCH22835.1 flagellin [Mesorhizobium sp. L-8-3]